MLGKGIIAEIYKQISLYILWIQIFYITIPWYNYYSSSPGLVSSCTKNRKKNKHVPFMYSKIKKKSFLCSNKINLLLFDLSSKLYQSWFLFQTFKLT